jgi:hypothetical protein
MNSELNQQDKQNTTSDLDDAQAKGNKPLDKRRK